MYGEQRTRPVYHAAKENAQCAACNRALKACICAWREKARADSDASDPHARLIEHDRYVCLVVEAAAKQSNRERLRLLQAQEIELREREERFLDEQ